MTMIASGTAPQRLLAIHTGRVAPLGPKGVPSAFRKHAVAGPVAAGTLGLAGDEQGDRRVHGGPDKAIYGYAVHHYAAWAAEFPALAWGPGALGENLVLDGADEDTVCIGDTYRIGTAVLRVTQCRQPCSTMAMATSDPLTVRAMTKSGRCGWYFSVPEPGVVTADDAVLLLDRPNPDWTVARFAVAIRKRPVDPAVAALTGVAEQWR